MVLRKLTIALNILAVITNAVCLTIYAHFGLPVPTANIIIIAVCLLTALYEVL